MKGTSNSGAAHGQAAASARREKGSRSRHGCMLGAALALVGAGLLSGCVTSTPGGKVGLDMESLLRGEFPEPTSILDQRNSPMGQVVVAKSMIGGKYWLTAERTKDRIELSDTIQSIEFLRDYGTRDNAMLVYRMSQDDCPLQYQIALVNKDRLLTAPIGDCYSELHFRRAGDQLHATNSRGLYWAYDGQSRVRGPMSDAQYAVFTGQGQGQGQRSRQAAQPPRSSSPSPGRPQTQQPAPQQRMAGGPPIPTAPRTAPPPRLQVPDRSQLPTAVNREHREGTDKPLVVLN